MSYDDFRNLVIDPPYKGEQPVKAKHPNKGKVDDSIPRTTKVCHSRITFLSDKAGKTRVIALGDILTQSFLKPLHKRLNQHLKALDADATFDQERAKRQVRNWTFSNKKLFSIDMKSCTDRLPAIIQALALYRCQALTFGQAVAW